MSEPAKNADPAPEEPQGLPRVLVVDDEEGMRHMVGSVLRREGYDSIEVESAEEALERLAAEPFGVVFCDVRMPGMDGIEFLKALRKRGDEPTVIIMSAYGSLDLAREAIQHGAYDYLNKPFTADDAILAVTKASERERLRAENRRLRAFVEGEGEGMGGIIGRSPNMIAVFDTIRKVAKFPSIVLITGESGTGKELVARAIHEHSPRSKKPFIAVNCGAIPETLIESELFGHAKGAFTGAVRAKKGLVQEANGGTLFLDEIGELPPPLQVKLLRFLQEGEIRRVGETKPVKVDARVVAATSRDLAKEVAESRFREDLFYRLNVLPIHLPPLRERRDDIPLLLDHFLVRFSAKTGRDLEGFSPEALERILADPWTGNVRELENAVEQTCVLASGPIIQLEDLPDRLRSTPAPDPESAASESAVAAVAAVDPEELSIKKATRSLEKHLIQRALEQTGGNRTQAARLLEISHRALLYKIREYGLE